MKKLIAGNWKMNGDKASALALVKDVEGKIAASPELLNSCDFVVCPPFVHLSAVKDALGKSALGAQDCSDKASGAFTGDTAPSMIKDIGAAYVILGHSERRQYHKEGDALVNAKAALANQNGLITIICVGELEAEREAGKEFDVVSQQLNGSLPDGATAENTVIAYEPVWAIGTGISSSPEQTLEVFTWLRNRLSKDIDNSNGVRILYGGSANAKNAKDYMNIRSLDGLLIGGASLKP